MNGSVDLVARLINRFNSMYKFEYVDDIPQIPNIDVEFYTNIILPNLLRCGGIDKSKLVVNRMYKGSSKYAKKAMWNGNCFIYLYEKCGKRMLKNVSHFQDYAGDDVFIPIEEII